MHLLHTYHQFGCWSSGALMLFVTLIVQAWFYNIINFATYHASMLQSINFISESSCLIKVFTLYGGLQSLDIIWVRYFCAFAFNKCLPPHWICHCALSNGAWMTIRQTVQKINTQRTGSSSCQTDVLDIHRSPPNVLPVHLRLNAPNI